QDPPRFGIVTFRFAAGDIVLLSDRLLRTDKRQADDELAALARAVAVGADTAAVQFDQAPHQRQADAQAALRTRPRASDLDEGVEDARQHLFGDADPRVTNPDHDFVSLARGAEKDAPAGLG